MEYAEFLFALLSVIMLITFTVAVYTLIGANMPVIGFIFILGLGVMLMVFGWWILLAVAALIGALFASLGAGSG